MKNITLGFVAIARPTFDMTLAVQNSETVYQQLTTAGFHLIGTAKPIATLEETIEAAPPIQATSVDLLIIVQATFADSLMAVKLAELVDAPLLLWAVPEARTGGRLRSNSLCGINLAGHALTRAGYRYDYVYADTDDATALAKVQALAQAAHALQQLRQTRIGVIGDHPAGFDTCRFDAPALKKQLGVEVQKFELTQVFGEIEQTPAEIVQPIAERLQQTIEGVAEVDQVALRGSLATYATLRRLAQEERLAGLAVRCWPEFFTELGCAACGAMSMLSDEMTPCSCEADVNGTITQVMLQAISGQPAFGSDMVAMDKDADELVIWHCGLAPLTMADPTVRPRATIHSNRRMPLLMEFPLKPGVVTLARLSEATGEYRLVVGKAEMRSAPMSFGGTSGVLRFERPAHEILDVIMAEGLEHHLSLTYGDHVAAVLALAKMLNLPVLCL